MDSDPGSYCKTKRGDPLQRTATEQPTEGQVPSSLLRPGARGLLLTPATRPKEAVSPARSHFEAHRAPGLHHTWQQALPGAPGSNSPTYGFYMHCPASRPDLACGAGGRQCREQCPNPLQALALLQFCPRPVPGMGGSAGSRAKGREGVPQPWFSTGGPQQPSKGAAGREEIAPAPVRRS